MRLGSLPLIAVLALITPGRISAQMSAQDIEAFHDRATTAIRSMANRPLTPGDTFLTWNPTPGGLIHTVAVGDTEVVSSLLRGDGMIGTEVVAWRGEHPVRFSAVWTVRDSASGMPRPDVDAKGQLRGDTLLVTGSHPGRYATPSGRWGVADFGMEEQLIPLIRQLRPPTGPVPVEVFRPWHGRWDLVRLSVRDTAGYRVADLRDSTSHETIVLLASGNLLWMWRHDQTDERRPLEGSARYRDYEVALPLLRSLATRDAPRSNH